jgi:S-formylglutathione hydrolase FrmB
VLAEAPPAPAEVRPLLLVLALAALTAGPAHAAARDIELVDSEQLTPRLSELTLRTPALEDDTHVRVLLPEGYDAAAARRYPVLYLLHGCCDDYRSWSDKGHAEQVVGAQPLIVVMPDGGQAGFYSNWHNGGAGGPPRWESYHVRQLVPWIDAHYRTVAARRGRAITGLSMGGFGAMKYAARHPGMFVAAASFSGAVDSNTNGGTAVITGAPTLDGRPNGSVFGPRASEEVRWRGHNPTDLAENLRGLDLTVRTGNGQPGGEFGGGPDPIESGVHEMSVNFHARLDALAIPHVWEDYGPGAHQWPYWERDLAVTLPTLMDAFARRPRPPARFSFAAIEPRYSVYGWRVRIKRPALEFSRFERTGRRGFALSGSGRATVVTPPRFRPRARYRVKRRIVRASRRGRLRIRLRLGQGNEQQQYTAGAETKVFRVGVRIRRA